jgi:thiamine phosphate synthase YjbQ (UPF0047 family)
MRIAQTRLSIDTAPREIKEITAEITRWVERQHIALELPTVYISHTSASLLIQETASPDVRRDLDAFLRDPSRKRCAIYTRKSSEEGLEQEFNAPGAMRSLRAYIAASVTRTGLAGGGKGRRR